MSVCCRVYVQSCWTISANISARYSGIIKSRCKTFPPPFLDLELLFVPYTLIGYFSRMTLPYLNNSAGTGTNAIARNPSRLFPQPNPRVSYIVGPASGSNAPNKHRRAVMPAMAEAANCGKQSITNVGVRSQYMSHMQFVHGSYVLYVWRGAKMPMRPKPNGTREMMGTIQCTL
jgi:hypothetical protein